METTWAVNLGDIAKDRITGLQGVVICRSEWLNGCRRITIQPRELKDGKPIETSSFDVEDIEVLKSKAFPNKHIEQERNGPTPEVPRFR